MMEELKNCPFCGKDLFKQHEDTEGHECWYSYLACLTCGASGPKAYNLEYHKLDFQERARVAWNERVIE